MLQLVSMVPPVKGVPPAIQSLVKSMYPSVRLKLRRELSPTTDLPSEVSMRPWTLSEGSQSLQNAPGI